MIQQSRSRRSLLLAGWFFCLLIFGAAIYFFGPSSSRIVLLSVSDGMTITVGSVLLLGLAVAAYITVGLIQWTNGGLESIFELPSSSQSGKPIARNLLPRTIFIASYALVCLLACYFLFVRLNESLMCAMPHDSFIFFDGALRLASGQTQHIDFHTPMGIFCNLIPYFGLQAAHGFAGSMEWGSLIAGGILLSVAVAVISSRLSMAVAILVVPYICLMAVVPLSVEGLPEGVTHAMFFNRLGWIAITLIFVFFLEPRFPSKPALIVDSVVLGFLLFFLFYLKLSYFVVAIGFLPLLFISSRYNRLLSLFSFSIFAIGVGAIEYRYGLNGPYLRDVLMAIRASGVNRGSMAPHFVANIEAFSLVAAAVALTWQRTRSNWMYLICVGFIALGGLAIIDQNTQATGIVCLLAALMISQELVMRRIKSANTSNEETQLCQFKAVACLGLIALFVIQSIAFRSCSMMMIRSAITHVRPAMPGNLQGMVFEEHLWKHFCSGKIREPYSGKIVPEKSTSNSSYLETILEGVEVLKTTETDGKHVMVFDFVTPFSMILSMEPAKGGHTAIDYGRTMGDHDYSDAEELLGAVDYVMVPRIPIMPATTRFLLQTYGPYLESHFDKTYDEGNWTLWSRRSEGRE